MFAWIRKILRGGAQDWPKSTSAKLLKEATAKKRQGNLDAAIKLLKKAYVAIQSEFETHSIDTYLRLPMFLQLAERNDEAWAEFNKLLTEGIPGQQVHREILPMYHSKIYDKMHLFLQRNKQPLQAVSYGVLSTVSWGKGLYYQKRRKELKKLKDREAIENTVRPLLKKAKRLDATDDLVSLVQKSLNDFPKTNFSSVSKRVGKILAAKQV